MQPIALARGTLSLDRLAPMDFSRLNRNRVLVGGVASLLLIVSILFLPWYSLEENPQRLAPDTSEDVWLCGVGENECTGFETFPILRWLLLLAALAPPMVAGFAAMVLIGYNGIIDRPGTGPAEIGVSLDYGYWLALLAAIVIAGTGFTRSLESG